MRGPGSLLCGAFSCILLRREEGTHAMRFVGPVDPDGKYSAKPNQDSAHGGNRAAFKRCFFHCLACLKERSSNQPGSAEPCPPRCRRTRLPAEPTRQCLDGQSPPPWKRRSRRRDCTRHQLRGKKGLANQGCLPLGIRRHSTSRERTWFSR